MNDDIVRLARRRPRPLALPAELDQRLTRIERAVELLLDAAGITPPGDAA